MLEMSVYNTKDKIRRKRDSFLSEMPSVIMNSINIQLKTNINPEILIWVFQTKIDRIEEKN